MTFCIVSSAKAAFDCSAKPTCTSLGYVSESLAKCSNQQVLRCPFDTSYVFCGEDTIGLNCSAGRYFNINIRACYPDDTTSDYAFIKYNKAKTKAYLVDLTKSVQNQAVSTISEATTDDNPLLLDRDSLSTLLSAPNSDFVKNKNMCYRVRNGSSREVVFVRSKSGNITSTVSTNEGIASSSLCNGKVSVYYSAKANLY